jgi:hypothetical protein
MLHLHVITLKFVNLSSSTIYLFVSKEKSTTLSGRPQALPHAVGRRRRSLARRRPRPFPRSRVPPPRVQAAQAASPVPRVRRVSSFNAPATTFSFSVRSRSRAANATGSELPVAATTELEQRCAILCCDSRAHQSSRYLRAGVRRAGAPNAGRLLPRAIYHELLCAGRLFPPVSLHCFPPFQRRRAACFVAEHGVS